METAVATGAVLLTCGQGMQIWKHGNYRTIGECNRNDCKDPFLHSLKTTGT